MFEQILKQQIYERADQLKYHKLRFSQFFSQKITKHVSEGANDSFLIPSAQSAKNTLNYCQCKQMCPSAATTSIDGIHSSSAKTQKLDKEIYLLLCLTLFESHNFSSVYGNLFFTRIARYIDKR